MRIPLLNPPLAAVPAARPAINVAAVFPPRGLAVTHPATSRQGIARSLSAALCVRHEYLNLK